MASQLTGPDRRHTMAVILSAGLSPAPRDISHHQGLALSLPGRLLSRNGYSHPTCLLPPRMQIPMRNHHLNTAGLIQGGWQRQIKYPKGQSRQWEEGTAEQQQSPGPSSQESGAMPPHHRHSVLYPGPLPTPPASSLPCSVCWPCWHSF